MAHINRKITVPVGGVWEEASWTIYVQYESDYGERCPHTRETSRVKIWLPGGRAGYETRIVEKDDPLVAQHDNRTIDPILLWPLVAVVKNEGGHNSTGLCILCLQEHLDDCKDCDGCERCSGMEEED